MIDGGVAGGAVGAGPCGFALGAKTSTVTAPTMPINKAPMKKGSICDNVPLTVIEVNVFTTGAKPKTNGITNTGFPP